MPSIISAGLTGGTALNLSGDTSGVLQIQTNGSTPAMTIDTSQNVGIGTTSPSEKLHVNSGTGNVPLLLESTDPVVLCAFKDNNTTTTVGVGAQSDALIFLSNTERMRLDSSGNLGLGVTPSAWNGGYKALQIGSGVGLWGAASGATGTYLTNNVLYNASGNRTYLYTGTAAEYSQGGGAHYWMTASSGTAGNAISFTQAMTLDSSGNLLVGTTSGTGNGEKLNSTNSSGSAFRFNGSTAAGSFTGDDINHYITTYSSKAGGAVTHYQIGFYNSSGTNVGGITHNFSNTTYSTSSDYRLKENIAPMTGALATVAQLKPCTYTWKSNGSAGQGFIAHELQEVVPDAVVGEKDAVNEDGSIKPQGIDTSFLVATLTAAIQELKAELDTVKAELNTLKGQ